MANTVTVSGMFGNDKTYFADSPVVIDIDGLYWGDAVSSPFTVVRVEVLYEGRVVGKFRADTGGQTSISFDISSALRAIWSGFDFGREVAAASSALAASGNSGFSPADDDDYSNGVRSYREYSLIVYTEYIDSTDGEFTTTYSDEITGGRCTIGGMTEWERSTIAQKEDADVSSLEDTNMRNGDASTKPTTKPTDYPERVGRDSITSWVDVNEDGTKSIFFPASADSALSSAPIVLRDSIPYTDFLFVNRRGAVETCSAQMMEAMEIGVNVQQYARVERPAFQPSRSLMAVASEGRRSWSMSSGYVTREWAEWWVMEFLKARQWWMLYQGHYVPVVVEPAKSQTNIYDRAKQQMPSVEFTVTMALEG